MLRQELSLGYIVVVRSENDSQEFNGDIHRALPRAIELFKCFLPYNEG